MSRSVVEATEVKRHVDVIAPNRIRIVESRELPVDRALVGVLLQSQEVPVGVLAAHDGEPTKHKRSTTKNVSVDLNEERQTFKTSAQLLAAKARNIVTGHEPWYRTEYMRLKQNERRAELRKQHRRKSR